MDMQANALDRAADSADELEELRSRLGTRE